MFRSIYYLPTEDSDWFNTGQLAQQLRAKGITLPLTDVLIAVIAQRYVDNSQSILAKFMISDRLL